MHWMMRGLVVGLLGVLLMVPIGVGAQGNADGNDMYASRVRKCDYVNRGEWHD